MDSSKPLIAPMSPDTVQAVEGLERECFANPWSLDSLAGELANPLAVFRTATVDGELAGYAGMHHVIDEGYITNIAVARRFRRRGIAAALLQDLLDYAGDSGLAMMTLEVRPSNTAAITLYKRFGFVETGRRREYYRDPTEDGLIMTRKL